MAAKKTESDKAKATDYATTFEANPDAQQLHVTSDEQAFVSEVWAKSHARSLDDKTIKVVPRDGEAETEAAE